ncbi:MAG TPA: ferric reductase-like transmembrane domain-containing protein [Acidimicrobiales bacterium]|nr:ferric reductase-like transmembrane domain-containing protein [Acidimicrobiales bacterium]
MIGAETPSFVWYVMRASGFVTLMLLTLTILLGVVGVTRLHSARWPRLVTAQLHRNVALTACCFLALHIVTALVDSWVGLSWIGILVPFRARYRPLWLAFGVVAFDLFLAVVASSLLRRRIGVRRWRTIHWATWALWPLALVHALGSGTDTSSNWGLGICLVAVAAVLGALSWRVITAIRHPRSARDTSTDAPTKERVPITA